MQIPMNVDSKVGILHISDIRAEINKTVSPAKLHAFQSQYWETQKSSTQA